MDLPETSSSLVGIFPLTSLSGRGAEDDERIQVHGRTGGVLVLQVCHTGGVPVVRRLGAVSAAD